MIVFKVRNQSKVPMGRNAPPCNPRKVLVTIQYRQEFASFLKPTWSPLHSTASKVYKPSSSNKRGSVMVSSGAATD